MASARLSGRGCAAAEYLELPDLRRLLPGAGLPMVKLIRADRPAAIPAPDIPMITRIGGPDAIENRQGHPSLALTRPVSDEGLGAVRRRVAATGNHSRVSADQLADWPRLRVALAAGFWLHTRRYRAPNVSAAMGGDGLLTLFFLVVGLEIKREFTVGRLATWRSAADRWRHGEHDRTGALVPAGYLREHGRTAGVNGDAYRLRGHPSRHDGAGVQVALRILPPPPSSTILAPSWSWPPSIKQRLSSRLPGRRHHGRRGRAGAAQRVGCYHLTPYLMLKTALWACVYANGLHATLAGVILA
jgi:hypothetical protein